MEIQGHIQNGLVVPDVSLGLPEGAKVTIVVPSPLAAEKQHQVNDRHARTLEALAHIDAIENENPGDSFSGADHDQVLYGDLA